jgi:hypothetical protein
MKQITATINHRGDPFNGNIIPSGNQKRVKSTYYSGEYYNITASVAANYPDEAPTRYFIELPLVPDVSDLTGLMPISIRDVTSSTNLTRVSSVPGVNQYRIVISQTGIDRPHILELHSGQAGHTIGFDYYGKNTILNREDFEQFSVNPGISGTQLFFDVSKAAIRAGADNDGTNWNNSNVGSCSCAFGFNTVASGQYSKASGYSTVASGEYSEASGFNTVASAIYSIATGYGSVAIRRGQSSFASDSFVTGGDCQNSTMTIKGVINNNSNTNFDFLTETNKSYIMQYHIVARSSTGNTAVSSGRILAKNNSGTVSVVNEAAPILTASGTTGFSVTNSASSTNIRINIAQGASGEALRITLTYYWSEVGF